MHRLLSVTMSIIAVLAAVKALFLGASWLKWSEMRRQKILMGNNRNCGSLHTSAGQTPKTKDGGRNKTPDLLRFQAVGHPSSSCSHSCFRVHAPAGDSVGSPQASIEVVHHKTGGSLMTNLTPSTKSVFLAGIGLWVLMWAVFSKPTKL